MKRLNVLIERDFASYKGLARLLLTEAEYVLGTTERFVKLDFQSVNRLVFVCLGNINRSAFAEAVAKDSGFHAVSIGLATTTGHPAFPTAVKIATEMGYQLNNHSATDVKDFTISGGDLYVAMELRHARRLSQMGFPAHRTILLGYWSRPQRMHLHDPHGHSEDYFRSCFTLIQSAVSNLVIEVRKVQNPYATDILPEIRTSPKLE